MKIDLHVHAKERSACSTASERELIERARQVGLDALVFTDHERLIPPEHLDELNSVYAPFRIFSGIEIRTEEEEDVLVYGLQHQRLERMSWSYADLHRFVHAEGGYLVLAHPFRYRDEIRADIRAFPPDAIEARSRNIRDDLEPRIRRTAADTRSAVVYASDAHSVNDVGAFYVTLAGAADGDRTLVALLRSRAFACLARPDGVRI